MTAKLSFIECERLRALRSKAAGDRLAATMFVCSAGSLADQLEAALSLLEDAWFFLTVYTPDSDLLAVNREKWLYEIGSARRAAQRAAIERFSGVQDSTILHDD